MTTDQIIVHGYTRSLLIDEMYSRVAYFLIVIDFLNRFLCGKHLFEISIDMITKRQKDLLYICIDWSINKLWMNKRNSKKDLVLDKVEKKMEEKVNL